MNQYERELGELAGKHHGRNNALLRLALLGLADGRDPDTVFDEIIRAGGEPRLGDAEVLRAVKKALSIRQNSNSPSRTWKPHGKLEKNSEKQKKFPGFVRGLIQEGGNTATLDDLKALSLSDSRDLLSQVLKPDKLYFFGDMTDRRTRDKLMTPGEMAQKLATGHPPPPLFTPNPFTGEKGHNEKGAESYCLDALIAERTLALIEFDALPIEQQAAFWRGVIRNGAFRVESLVFSGHKSIHGLIRLEPADWEGQWRQLEALLASDPDSTYRCDVACKNAGRMTRFPGARNPKNGALQELLFLGAKQ